MPLLPMLEDMEYTEALPPKNQVMLSNPNLKVMLNNPNLK